MIEIITPTLCNLIGYQDKEEALRKFLTFEDQTAKHEVQRFKNARWYLNKYGEKSYHKKLEELKEKQNVCLLLEPSSDVPENVNFQTYAGLAYKIAKEFNDIVVNKVEYPKPEVVPYDRIPPKMRYYQEEAVEKLLLGKHAGVSMPTGAGKSLCILEIVKSLGLKTLIMTPSVSINNQIYDLFKHHFGTKYVCMYGDGKKKTDKLITIGTAQSLTRIKDTDEAWKNLSKIKVFIADESHLCPADTLERVCTNIAKNAPYRFFFSATQMRNDGSDLLLDGITGPIVYEIHIKDLIDKGFLAKPNFYIFKVKKEINYEVKDTLKMLDKHLYNNASIHRHAAELANHFVKQFGHQVMIMIDRVEQFKYLEYYFKYPFNFAHGGVTKVNRGAVNEKYHKSDPDDLVKRFNNKEFPILVGTSCISIGTDIRPVNTIINLQGGRSEVKFKQLVGRGTRLAEGKKEFNFIDYDIIDVPIMHFHSFERYGIYKDIYDNIRILNG